MNQLKEELRFCLNIWEKQGYCTFGGKTNCEQCASPYLIFKLITGEILDKDAKRLTLREWKKKFNTNSTYKIFNYTTSDYR